MLIIETVFAATTTHNEATFAYYRRLGAVASFVRANLDQPIDLARAATVAGLSEKYFSAYFRQRVGVGFHRWLTALRVEKAAELFRSSDDGITQVAFEVGFRDIRTFERNFKRHFAMTPRHYRNQVRPGT